MKTHITRLKADLKTIVDFAKMDLGEPRDDSSCGAGLAPASPRPRGPWYPTLYIHRKEKIDLPRKGKAVIEYRLRDHTVRTDEDGKTTESADIEIQSIDPVVETKKPAKAAGTVIPVNTAQLKADLKTVIDFARNANDEYKEAVGDASYRLTRKSHITRGRLVGGGAGAAAGAAGGYMIGKALTNEIGKELVRRRGEFPVRVTPRTMTVMKNIPRVTAAGYGLHGAAAGALAGAAIGRRINKAKPDRVDPEVREKYRRAGVAV
ncbi:hypothetical protein OpiT1DRAFT_05616 [Opitutaceae bacterium TAV1]|nr:hypothetical protein OpiT1DRAFT_05616 [Opitutaceae bacterium TAV1]